MQIKRAIAAQQHSCIENIDSTPKSLVLENIILLLKYQAYG